MFGLSQPAPDSPKSTIKFLCSYGGKILPRYPDGKLRYLGGHTRVVSVDRSVQFSELLPKLEELCGSSVTHLRCQLPAEDLDALVSITSDEDLVNLIEEYDRTASPQLPLKIKAFISPPRSLNKVSKPPLPTMSKTASVSSSSSASSTSSSSSFTGGGSVRKYTTAPPVVSRCVHHTSQQNVNHVNMERSSGRNIPLQRNCNHWQ
ncbi:protein PAL OF QUIRKY-like [Vicia villosa]|uniref:protein PAL OF QUIRKY-like n=1 Tax=Vicia villosa TaxID=3911 RepID=UPI00273B0BE3|nr:protein PAL OF QUIRKY-like [Vicia villosa]XP_058776300.1 protein PAL OF QUIRKY-like [Vicia villosa]XP_058776301.1 protein PAL OF QUIRKY-like [Vicia villosa]